MDKLLLNKVKSILITCTAENVSKVRSQLMVILKPHEADEVFQYFVSIEKNYIKETCRVHTHEVIPQYNDYFSNPNDIASFIIDDDYDTHD